jgi:hypothetical protein
MSTLLRLRSLLIPAGIGLILMVAALSYNLFWLPSQHRYFDDRNFRVLKTLSEQIRLNFNVFDKMMDNAAASGITSGSSLQAYLKNVAPQLQQPKERESKSVVGEDFGDPPRLAVSSDEGTHFLYLAFAQDNGPGYSIRTDLDKLIDKLLPPARRCPFDAVVVAQSDGTVIYQKSQSGIIIARIDTLENASGDAKPGKPIAPIAVDSLSRSSKLEEVKIAGARYRLYTQPIQLPFVQANPNGKHSRDVNGAVPTSWILCGLIRADRFRSESQTIPNTYMLWLVALILLAVTAYPFLKIHIASPAERVRARDVIAIAISICFEVTILTFVILDIGYCRNWLDRSAGDQMKKLADAIDSNFGDEKKQAFAQVQSFYAEDSLRTSLQKAQFNPDLRVRLKAGGTSCNPSWACREHVLSNSDPARSAKSLESYPYLQFVNWSDSQGKQRVKWTTGNATTPFLNLDDPSVQYYPPIKAALHNPDSSDPALAQGIGSQYSPNSGENITVFWQVKGADGNPLSGTIDSKGTKKLFCASLITRPISVVDSVLPAGFQFAIIRPDGTVIFHSDRTRNLFENFFAETDRDQAVQSKVSMRTEGSLVTEYMGRPYRLFIHPMDSNRDNLWTIVVFRDLHSEQMVNLQVLGLASIMFLIYCGSIVLVLAVNHRPRTCHVAGHWLWPDSRKAIAYRRLTIANSIAAVLFFVLGQISSPFAVVVWTLLIPAATLIVNLVALRCRNNAFCSPRLTDNSGSSRWQAECVGTWSTLLMTIVVLPCLCFFKVACDFEYRIFVERGQLRLAADLDERARAVRSRYQRVDLGAYRAQILAAPEQKTTPYFSYHEALEISIDSSHSYVVRHIPASSSLSVFTTIGRQRCLELLLSRLNPFNGQLVADSEYLADTDPSSDAWHWTFELSSREKRAELTIHEPGDRALRISSPCKSFNVSSNNWLWWLGAAVFFSIIFRLIRLCLRKIFFWDLFVPSELETPPIECNQKVHRSLFSRRPKLQKLVLVHLAQENLANPNSRPIVSELIKEGLVGRGSGLLTIKDDCFAGFLKQAAPPEVVKRWEEQTAGIRSASLRTSLIVGGLGLVAFLIYTQADVFNTWVTYLTGLAASVPVFLRLFDAVRRNGGS